MFPPDVYQFEVFLNRFFILLTIMENSAPFFNAIRNGDLGLASKMIDENPGLLQAKDHRGSTPLILATYYNHEKVAIFLIEKGAHIDAVDDSGNTALMGVCFKGFTAIAEKLISYGANVNVQNGMGATSLIYSATFKQVEIAKLLLENGADSTMKDGRGNTALDHAKLQGVASLIDLLES